MLSIIIFIFSPSLTWSCILSTMYFHPQQWKLRASSRNKWNLYYYFMSGSVWFLRSFATTCEVVLSWGHAFHVAPPVTECLIASFIYLLYYIHSFLYNCSLYLKFVKSLCSWLDFFFFFWTERGRWLDLVMRQLKAESKGSLSLMVQSSG